MEANRNSKKDIEYSYAQSFIAWQKGIDRLSLQHSDFEFDPPEPHDLIYKPTNQRLQITTCQGRTQAESMREGTASGEVLDVDTCLRRGLERKKNHSGQILLIGAMALMPSEVLSEETIDLLERSNFDEVHVVSLIGGCKKVK